MLFGPPQLNDTVPPPASAVASAASVQLAGVPSPTTPAADTTRSGPMAVATMSNAPSVALRYNRTYCIIVCSRHLLFVIVVIVVITEQRAHCEMTGRVISTWQCGVAGDVFGGRRRVSVMQRGHWRRPSRSSLRFNAALQAMFSVVIGFGLSSPEASLPVFCLLSPVSCLFLSPLFPSYPDGLKKL
jgi:hypothetical protein